MTNINLRMRTFLFFPCLIGLALLSPRTAKASIILTNNANIVLTHVQTELGGDTSDDPNVINGAAGLLLPYTATGNFSCCGPNFLADKLNNGDIGVGVPSSGFYAIPNAGPASLTLSFGTTMVLGSIAIYNGYGNRDDGSYTLKDGLGNILGAWTISGTSSTTNDGVDSFWLTFKTPVSTNNLVFDTTSTDSQPTNSYREIQVLGPVPEPASLTLIGLGLTVLTFGQRKRF